MFSVTMNDTDLVAPDLLKLLELYSAQEALRFPDLDADVLRAHLGRVKERHLDVLRAEAGLLAARAAFEQEQDALARIAQRAAAYLRVYAEGDEALSLQVEALSLPRPRRVARPAAPQVELAPGEVAPEAPVEPPRKRGRPRKHPAQEPSLDFSGDAASLS